MLEFVTYRVRLSTIVKADNDNEALRRLCYRIMRKRREYGLVKPVVVIDVVPDEFEQRVAAGFLDMFAPVYGGAVCYPEFIFKNGIRKENLMVFFEEYEKYLPFYEKHFKMIECKEVVE